MKKLRFTGIIITSALTASLFTGCFNGGGKAVQTEAGSKSPITFTFFAQDKDSKATFDDNIAKQITKETGVTIKYQVPTDGSGTDVSLMIASKEYPDFIYAKGDSSKLIDAGAFLRLDDPKNNLIEKAPNVKNLFGDYMPRLKYSLQDPSIYTLGTTGPGGERWTAESYFWIQNAALKELGYPKIKNLKEYEKAITDYVAKNPTIDGKKTIGLTLNMDSWKWMISLGNPAGFSLGYQDDGQWAIDQSTYKATYKFMLPEMREYFRWLNGMNAKGLIDPDSFTQKNDAYIAKLSTGRVVAILDAGWGFGAATGALNREMPERSFATLPLVLDDKKYKDHTTVKQAYVGGGYGTGISVSCKNPERAMEYINYICSDEFQVMNAWGIKGKDYTVDANGTRIETPDIIKMKKDDKEFATKTGIGLHGWPFPTRPNTLKDPSGNYYGVFSPEKIISDYTQPAKDTLAAYGAKKWLDLFPQESEFKEPPYGAAWMTNFQADSDDSVVMKKADGYLASMIPKSLLVSPSEFDATWDEIQAQLKKLGMERVSENYTKLIADKIKLWTK